jgi:hypothetical protein
MLDGAVGVAGGSNFAFAEAAANAAKVIRTPATRTARLVRVDFWVLRRGVCCGNCTLGLLSMLASPPMARDISGLKLAAEV